MAGRNCCKCVTVSLVPTASLILVILFACGIILLPILYVELSYEYKYGIVIDAGSSHTTLYGYRWRVPTKNHSTGVIEVKEIYHCTKQRSLNSFASKPSEAYKAIEHCVNQSKNYKHLQLDDKHRPYMPIYLGATAGMRVLDMNNHSATNAILSTIRATLRKSGYSFNTSQHARIISGEEEAIGGWTTVNYLDKNLNPPKKTTVGSLDLGGASSQIAFEVPNESPYTASEKLFNRKYNLSARSYLCYGVNEAYRRFLASLINSAVQKDIDVFNTSIPNPCLTRGSNITYHRNEIYTGCVNSSAAMEAFGFGYAPPTLLAAENDVNFKGAWNAEECRGNITEIFNFSQCWPKSNCLANNFTLPPGTFTAFSTFSYIAHYFPPDGSSTFTVKKEDGWGSITNAVANNCSVTRNSTNDECVTKGKMKGSCYQNCFNGLFMLHLLENGFGFNNKSTTNNWTVEFQDQMQGVTVGWALGYMLSQTTSIPQDQFMELRPYTAVDLVVGILILTILCVVFFIFFFLTFYACRKALRPRNGFQPL